MMNSQSAGQYEKALKAGLGGVGWTEAADLEVDKR